MLATLQKDPESSPFENPHLNPQSSFASLHLMRARARARRPLPLRRTTVHIALPLHLDRPVHRALDLVRGLVPG